MQLLLCHRCDSRESLLSPAVAFSGCYTPQSVDGGVSVPANISEDHPVCLREGAAAWRHHHLCGGSF